MTVAILLAVSVMPYFAKSATDYAYLTYKENTTNQFLQKQIEEAAQAANKKILKGRLINNQIALDSVMAGPGKHLTFFFVVVDMRDQLSDDQLAKLSHITRERLCSSNLRGLLDQGVVFHYKYSEKSARWTKEITVQPHDCLR